MRKPIIAGNWKMYKTPEQSVAFIEALLPLIAGHDRDEILIFPPFTSLAAAIIATDDHNIRAGAQNMHWLNEGPYTGEISPTMLMAIGCRHVLLGHSEQRLYFGETDDRVNLKLKAAINHGLTPIVCVGEQLIEREANLTAKVLELQVSVALEGIHPDSAANLIFAYEPVWAIGTGHTATPQTAEDSHKIIRAQIAKSLNPAIAASTRILYGGSVKPDNAANLCCLDDIDGALVGGASLDPTSLAQIIQNSAPESFTL
jgi:triosephosphate isomerase (TIM)